MPAIQIRTVVNRDFQSIVDGFDKNLFAALKPPLLQLEIVRFDGCKKGDKVELSIKAGPVRQVWHSLITDEQFSSDNWYFIDEGVKLPYPLIFWKHKHSVIAGDGFTLIRDDINFKATNFFMNIIMYPFLFIMFWYRKPLYKRYFS